MRNILAVFKYDIKTLSQHFFAMAVALAICLLPSLYAWLNIYSNWDPYGNTGNISIALASMDKGYVDDDGTVTNKGDEVLDNLREATSINWIFLDNEEEAVNGVYSGEYYAAVVIDEDFSYNMFNMLTEWTGKPSITYYENAKKNAVATKITDTAAESVKTSINEAYLEVVINTVMESANRIAEDIESDDPSGTFHGIIKQAITTLKAADQTMAAFSAATSGIPQNSLDTQRLDEILMQMEENMPAAADINATVAEINMNINEINARLEEALRILQGSNSSGGAVANAQQVVTDSADSLKALSETLGAMSNLPGDYGKLMTDMAAAADETSKWLYMLAEQEILAGTVENVSASLETLIALNSSFIPCVEDIGRELSATFLNVADLLESSKIMLSDAAVLKEAAAQTKADANEVVNILKPAGKRVTNSLNDVLHRLETLDGEEYIQTLIEILGGSPVVYGEYFAQVVQTTVTPVYPIANHGSAMAPFYTILSIWVGGVMLGAIFGRTRGATGSSTRSRMSCTSGATCCSSCSARYRPSSFCWAICSYSRYSVCTPGLLFVCGAVTSFTFSLLIYSLAVSFGDVGKAIVVVVMVLQIAGSSGTFPIELLPEIFRKIYRFFPFPYAIDAMRECICGVYGSTFIVKLGQLLIFAVVALLIGLFARKPFIGVNEFMEEQLEETGMFKGGAVQCLTADIIKCLTASSARSLPFIRRTSSAYTRGFGAWSSCSCCI